MQPLDSKSSKYLYVPKSFADFNRELEKSFRKLYKWAEHHDCSYLSYALENEYGQRVHFFSDEKWKTVFMNPQNHLHENDPVALVLRSNKSIIFPWSQLNNLNLGQKNVMWARNDFDMHSGLSMSYKFGKLRELIVFSSYSKGNGFQNVLMLNFEKINHSLKQIRQTAINSLSKSILLNYHHNGALPAMGDRK